MHAAAAIILALGLTGDSPCTEAVDRLMSRDRERQATAIRDLSAMSDCESALLETWRSTKRFDVRAGVTQILVARGDAGLARLIELVRDDHHPIGGEVTLLARALASRGMDAIAIIERDANDHDGRIIRVTYPIVRAISGSLDVKASQEAVAFGEALIRRLLASARPSVRGAALTHLELLPAAERLDAILRAVRSSDLSERSAGLGRLSSSPFTPWMVDDAETGPEAFSRYVEAICEFAASEQVDVAAPACAALGAIGSAPIALERRLTLLRRAVRDERWSPAHREQAMRGLLSADPDTARAVMEVVALAPKMPTVVGEVLERLRAEDVPDQAIQPLVAVLSRADGYNGNQLWTVVVRLKARAVPALVAAIDGSSGAIDPTQVRDASSALGAIGADAAVALPALLAVARPESTHPSAGAALAAAVRIAPRDEQVARLLRQAVQRASTDRAAAMVAWETLDRVLSNARESPDLPDAIGAEAIVRTILVERIEPLRQVLRSHRVVADAILKERAALEAGLREPRWREPITWGLIEATEFPPWLLDALIALARETFDQTIDAAGDQSGKERQAFALAAIMAKVCDLDPPARERIGRELRSLPKALAAIATAWYETEPHRMPAFPTMPASAVEILEAELGPRLERLEDGQRNAVLAFARLPNATPERSARLLEIVRYGEGTRGPMAALEGLGALRPFVESNLGVIREHLRHPHYEMVSAAVKAAEHAGPHAASLVGELIALGSTTRGYATETDAYRAVKAIAPETTDPDVLAFLQGYERRVRARQHRH